MKSYIEPIIDWVSNQDAEGLWGSHRTHILAFIAAQVVLASVLWIYFHLQSRRNARRIREAVKKYLTYAEHLHQSIGRSITVLRADLDKNRIYISGRAFDVLKELSSINDGLAARIFDTRELIEKKGSYEKALTLLQAPLSVRSANPDRLRSGGLYPEITLPEIKGRFEKQAEELATILSKRIVAPRRA